MPKSIGRAEKFLVYAFFGTFDLIQIILDFFAVGAAVNRIIDIVLAVLLLLYGAVRGLWTGRKLLVLLATFVGEAIPLVDAMPFWILDIVNVYSGTAQEMVQDELGDQPLNKEGMRLPEGQNRPFYNNGVGRVRE